MPELLEVEMYRRLADRVVGRSVAGFDAPDGWYLKGDTTPELLEAIVGARVGAARRIGKVLLLDLSIANDRSVLALRFGMTGRLLVDGSAAIDRLEYDSGRSDPAWDRFGLAFAGGGDLVVRDPRRLGGVELDPDLGNLGPDAMEITPVDLRSVITGRAPVKARLLDQSKIAGLGNLLVDEILWRARLDPARASADLDDTEVQRLSVTIIDVLDLLAERGGSHTGDLQDHRQPGALCPRCGGPLARRTIGGRTTYSCIDEQL